MPAQLPDSAPHMFLFLQAIFYQLLGETRVAVEKRDSSLVGFYNSLVLGLAALWTACEFHADLRCSCSLPWHRASCWWTACQSCTEQALQRLMFRLLAGLRCRHVCPVLSVQHVSDDLSRL